MASWGTYGSRSAKGAEKEKEKDRSRIPIIGLSRKSSVTSTTSTSKAPTTSTSWFTRGRRKQAIEQSQPPATSSLSTRKNRPTKPNEITVASRGEESNRQRQPTCNPGLSITASKLSSPTYAPEIEARQHKVLRRKPSSIDQRSRYARTESSLVSGEPTLGRYHDYMSSPDTSADRYPESGFGVALPTTSTSSSYLPTRTGELPHQATSSSRMDTYNTRQALKTPKQQLFPPLAPSFANSSGSSTTRRSESPGSFSRTSTPTSISSYSPGIPVATKSPLRTRQISPTRSRPPVTRNRQGNTSKQELATDTSPGLSAVQELATSSSSSSTVRGNQNPQPFGRHRNNAPASTQQGLTQREGTSRLNFPAQVGSRNLATSYREIQPRELDQPHAQAHDSFSHVAFSASQYPSKTPPPRPSREGTPRLEGIAIPSPVIRSNLSRLDTTRHRRRESLEKPLFPSTSKTEPSPASRPFEHSASNDRSRLTKSSRLPSPELATVGSSQTWPTAKPSIRSTTQHGASRSRNASRGREPSPISAEPGKSSSRFGFFSRRTSPVRNYRSESVEKPVKKGPAAGTGHEGYGKYARRGRSGSAGTSASRGRSSSSNGTTASVAPSPNNRNSSFTSRDEPEMDDFLRDRLSPVIISGGRVSSEQRNSGADLYRTTSGASSASVVSVDGSSLRKPQLPSQNRFAASATATNSTTSSRRASKSLPRSQRVSDSATGSGAEDSAGSTRSTVATRRSTHRSQLLNEGGPVRVPAPIDTRVVATSPSITSRDTLQSSALKTDSSLQLTDDISEGREGNWLRSKKAEKGVKPPSKWNFFHRANAAQKKPSGRRPSQDQERPQEVAVAIRPRPEARSVAYYAMIATNGQDVDDPEGLVPSLKDVERLQPSLSGSEPAVDYHNSSVAYRRHEYKHSTLLPSPPTMAGEFTNVQDPPSPKVLFRQPPPVSQPPVEDRRPTRKASEPRLQQVGRIPRVVSKRDRPHKPPPQSFSRPFARAPSAPEQQPTVDTYDRRIPETAERPILGIQTERIPSDPWGDPTSAKPASAPARPQAQNYGHGRDEFLIMPQRINSDLSGSSSSGIMSFVLAPADTKQSGNGPAEDEVWNEYDDFLDTVESPAPMPVETFENTSKRNSPPKHRMAPAPLQIRKGSSASSTRSISAQELPPITVAPTSALPSPPSRMALLSPNLASSPMSFSDFIAGYGDRNRSSGMSNLRQSSVSGSHYSQASIHSVASSSVEHKRHTQIMVEKTRNSSNSQSNLRFSALMTSKWLSFGRVLFSPAHTDIVQSTKQTPNRVLVLDGLGNDDWSFYCALTYPDATVYNLNSFKRMGSRRRNEIANTVQSPPNHRQIFHAGMSAPFPFPKSYFSTAVFRFPVATTEAAYYNAVSECKRVLRPGGYLEISILDLDMVNMGNRARRAVRGLKTRMQVARKDVDLKPLSDNIQKMLGRRGFENLRRGMVTVPVAGVVGDSRSGSLDEDRDTCFSDMLKDSSPQGDEGITKMVSKVGRWWYSRCYESPLALREGDAGLEEEEDSIWHDTALLRECEKRETGLKLLICYAQKPVVSKRRTISL
ncbi:MAG: hypothetical protein LQ339_006273 [Xanthoria mediterranea]|nr:MAG: hypothetical protein LQ339_006273 [Xanthoria mediterranea]